MQTSGRTPAFWATLSAYALFNVVSTWVVFVLALFVSYPGSRDEDKAARVVAHLEKLFLNREGIVVFAVFWLVSVGIHLLFWRGLIRNAPDLGRFNPRHVIAAVSAHVALFIGGHVLALPFVVS